MQPPPLGRCLADALRALRAGAAAPRQPARGVSKATLRAQAAAKQAAAQRGGAEPPPGAVLTVAALTHVAPMRADNLFAQAGLCLRREARQFCRGHDVQAAVLPQRRAARVLTGATKLDPASVTVDGEPLPHRPGVPLHLALHKPPGFTCTHALDEGRTVYELLPSEFQLRSPQLATVGRLDKHATGLLLLTQSGALNARLASPRSGVPKEYVVSLAQPLGDDLREVRAFASGTLALVDGSRARPAVLTPHRDPALRHVAKVVLAEGRHHQLRRMFAAVGHTVTGIHRTAYGGLRLPELGLAEGEWRPLRDDELAALLAASASAAALPPPTRQQQAGGGARVRVKRERPPRGAGDELDEEDEDEDEGGGDDEDEDSGDDDDDDEDSDEMLGSPAATRSPRGGRGHSERTRQLLRTLQLSGGGGRRGGGGGGGDSGSGSGSDTGDIDEGPGLARLLASAPGGRRRARAS